MIEALRISQSATDLLDERFADLAGINRTDARCLDIVQRLGRITAGELAAQAGLTTGAVTVVIDRMEQAGYLHRTRSETDRRKVHLDLTDRAHQLARLVYGQIKAAGEVGMRQMSVAEMALVTRFLRCNSYIQQKLAGILLETRSRGAATDPLDLAMAFASTVQHHTDAIRAELGELGELGEVWQAPGAEPCKPPR